MYQWNHQEPIQFSNWTQETNAFVPELNTSNLTQKVFPLSHTNKTPQRISYLSQVPSSLLKHIGIISKPTGGREIVKSGLLSCVRWKCDILYKQKVYVMCGNDTEIDEYACGERWVQGVRMLNSIYTTTKAQKKTQKPK